MESVIGKRSRYTLGALKSIDFFFETDFFKNLVVCCIKDSGIERIQNADNLAYL